jgi:tetratricopeptide (TPR) repeat protein
VDEFSRKRTLTELLEKARATEHSFWEGLTQQERAAVGEADAWSAKDVLAHITFWKERLADGLEAALHEDEPEPTAHFEEINRQVFQANRQRSWEDLLDHEGQVYSRLLVALEALTDDALDDPQRFAWTDGRPLWWRVGFSGYFHPLDHLSKLYIEQGKAASARELQERIAREMGGLDASERWQGTVLYNLACFYSLIGQPARAIEGLHRAFVLNPELIEWSKEDTDLEPLRDLPEYQTLYTTEHDRAS